MVQLLALTNVSYTRPPMLPLLLPPSFANTWLSSFLDLQIFLFFLTLFFSLLWCIALGYSLSRWWFANDRNLWTRKISDDEHRTQIQYASIIWFARENHFHQGKLETRKKSFDIFFFLFPSFFAFALPVSSTFSTDDSLIFVFALAIDQSNLSLALRSFCSFSNIKFSKIWQSRHFQHGLYLALFISLLTTWINA